MYLVVDCETNGLPTDWRAPVTNLSNWPRAVQIAWIAYDENHRETTSESRIIQPVGFRIPASATQVHGITMKRAKAEGVPIRDALMDLYQVAIASKYVFAHNANFDGCVIAAEYLRQQWQPPFTPETMTCTMKRSTDYCQLPGPYGYKWPKLDELYEHLFGTTFQGAHDARIDAAACACCFFELKNRGVIKRPRPRV